VKIVIYGLAITSSWGNGHATTYRSLCKALARRGHRIHFVEKNVEWYRNNRDLPNPEFCTVHLYEDWSVQASALVRISEDADAIVIGSYFPDAIAVTRALLNEGYGPVFFYDIDTPITMSRLRTHGGTSYLDAMLIPYYAAYLSFTGGPALREMEDRFGSPYAAPFYCSVDPELYRPTTIRAPYRCDLSYLGTFASDRQPKLMCLLNGTAALLPKSRFVVAGPQYPKEIAWQENVKRITHLAPPAHPAFYSSSRFTLNLTRHDMIETGYSPSVRLFEASACGAAILSDAWVGLEDFLTPGEEILLPRDQYEVTQILRGMPESERIRLGHRARERILSQHTAAHRAMEFESTVTHCSTKKGTAKKTLPKKTAPQTIAGTGPVLRRQAVRRNISLSTQR
jgi:spore maturation protein CgeB